jgi:hypothetical protein
VSEVTPLALDEFPWIPHVIANVMSRNGIRSRTQLAKRLGVYTSVVTEAFDEDWSGRATIKLLWRLRREFGVDIGLLVAQPATSTVLPTTRSATGHG